MGITAFNFTIAALASASVPIGSTYDFISGNSAGVTLVTTSPDQIYVGGIGYDSITLYAGDSLSITRDDGNRWVAFDGSYLASKSTAVLTTIHDTTIEQFADVNVVGATSGQTLTYDGTDWVNVTPTTTISGDVSGTGNTTNVDVTLATVNSNVGTFGSTTVVPTITVNAKGLVTAVTTNTLTTNSLSDVVTSMPVSGQTLVYSGTNWENTKLNWTSIDGTTTPTTLAGYGITDAITETNFAANLGIYASLESPTFTGQPTVPTAPTSTDTNQIANTAFVHNVVGTIYGGGTSTITYGSASPFTSATTSGAAGTAMVFDSAGNGYWAIANHNTGANYNVTSYIYKITSAEVITQFASASTNGALATALVIDGSGNLYWAIANSYNGTTHALNSYIYEITSGGTQTVFATASTIGASGTALAFDGSGNLYWAISNNYDGTTYNQTSNVYKITGGGIQSTFTSVSTSGALGTSLAFDTTGNLYWAVINNNNDTTNSLTSYVYKITGGGVRTTFTTASTTGGYGTSIAFDVQGNLYWAVTNYGVGTSSLVNYVFRINSAAESSTFTSATITGAQGTSLIIDGQSNVLWAIAVFGTGSLAETSFLYEVTPSAVSTALDAVTIAGNKGTSLSLDGSGNIYWSLANYTGTTSKIAELLQSLVTTGGLTFSAIQDTPTTLAGYGITDGVTISALSSALGSFAPLSSPTLIGVPTAPTATSGTNTTQLATTAFVHNYAAPLASPNLTGVPTAPTATGGTNNTQIATTAFVANATSSLPWSVLTGTPTTILGYGITDGVTQTQLTTTVSAYAPLASPNLTGVPTAPTASIELNDTQIATTAAVYSYAAPLASPNLTGVPTAPTATGGTNNTQIATTAFVGTTVSAYAPLASPHLTGVPTAPTPSSTDDSTQIATTAYVQSITSAIVSGVSTISLSSLTDTAIVEPTAGQLLEYNGHEWVNGGSLSFSSINSTPTTLSGYGITDALSLSGGSLAGALYLQGSPTSPLQAATKGYVDSAVGAGTVAGNGITKSGSTISVETVSDSRITSTSTGIDLAEVVTAGGPFNSITFDAYGRVTAGSNTAYLTANQNINITGDATGTGATSIAITLANSGVTAATYNNSATTVTPITVNAKGLVTATGTTITITPAFSSITDTPTTLTGYGITDAAPLASPGLTGVPTAPTPGSTDNSTKIATTAFVQQVVTNVIDLDLGSLTLENLADVSAGSKTSGQVLEWNGSAWVNASLPTTIAFSNVTDTPTTLTGYGITDAAPLASPGLTGVPTAPTVSNATNSTQLATTAFVHNVITSVAAELTGSGGGSSTISLESLADVSVTDAVGGQVLEWNGSSWVNATPLWSDLTGTPTTIAGYGITDAAPSNSPSLTGVPVAPTATSGTNTTQLATTAFVHSAVTGIAFSTLSATPTTIAGYGITDAITTATIAAAVAEYAPFPGYSLGQNATVTGNIQILVTSVYMQAGTYANLYANLGCASPTDTATLTAQTSGAVVLATLSNVGIPEPASTTGFTLSSPTWVNFYLVASSSVATAFVYGLGIK